MLIKNVTSATRKMRYFYQVYYGQMQGLKFCTFPMQSNRKFGIKNQKTSHYLCGMNLLKP